MKTKYNSLRCTIPYEKDINSEMVLNKINDIKSRGHIIGNVYIKYESSGHSDPPGIVIEYKSIKRTKPIF